MSWRSKPSPPPLGNFGDLYFQKPYTLSCSDQLVCTYIAGAFALEGNWRSVPPSFRGGGWHFLSGGGMDTCNYLGYSKFVVLVKWSTGTITKYLSEALYYYPWKKKFKNVSKNAIFLQFFEIFTNFKFFSSQMIVKTTPYYIPKLQATSYLHNKIKMSSIGCSSVILQDFLFPTPMLKK